MNVLFTSLLLPHPYADHASAFTVFNTIKHLSKKHDVSVVSFVRSEEEASYVRYIDDYCRTVKTVVLPSGFFHKLCVRARLLGLKPISVSNSYCREMSQCIESICRSEKFDVVQMEYTPMCQYVSETGSSACIANVHDLIHLTTERLATSLPLSRKKMEWLADSLVCKRYELDLYSRFSHTLTLTHNMKERLLGLNDSLQVSVVEPGVDVPAEQKTHRQGTGKKLIFMGAMWRDENIDAVLYFYNQIFGRIRKEIDDVELNIVGGSPSVQIQGLADDPNVRVHGYVEDLLPCYLDADVSIAPIRVAGGIMCKILDAMAVGLPVITTSQGNEGVNASHPEQIIIADDADEYADRTIELLRDSNRRTEVGQNGMDFVRTNFNWENSINKLESVYSNCVCS